MLTLQETLESQSNLKQLCANSPLKTNEISSFNTFYGINIIEDYIKRAGFVIAVSKTKNEAIEQAEDAIHIFTFSVQSIKDTQW